MVLQLFFPLLFYQGQPGCVTIVGWWCFQELRTQIFVCASHSGSSSSHFSLEMAFVSLSLLSPSIPGELKVGRRISTCYFPGHEARDLISLQEGRQHFDLLCWFILCFSTLARMLDLPESMGVGEVTVFQSQLENLH